MCDGIFATAAAGIVRSLITIDSVTMEAVMSSTLVQGEERVELGGPGSRHDLATYWGRVRHYAETTNPANLLARCVPSP